MLRPLSADRGCDSDWFREALVARGTIPRIPPTRSRKTPLDYDKGPYRQRHKIENLFVKREDWRRIAARQDLMRPPFGSLIVCRIIGFYIASWIVRVEVTFCPWVRGRRDRHI